MAAERKALEAEATAVKQERAQYAQILGQLAKQLETPDGEPDWDKLRSEDEFKFVVERQAWQVRQDRLNAIKAEQSRVATMQKQQQDAATLQYTEEENRKVLEKIPAWKDKAKAKAAISDLRDYAKTEAAGPTRNWITPAIPAPSSPFTRPCSGTSWRRPRLPVRLCVAPVQRLPGAGSASPGRPMEITRDKQRLAQTGSIEDAATIFEKAGIFQ